MSYESFPFVIGWELTLDCNLRCSHCASSAGHCRDNELTLQESLLICDQLPDLLVNEVIFTGGEPLLNPHWSNIAAYLHELGINTGMVTNGMLVTNDTITKMKECGINAVGVSIDGLEDTHDRIRGVPGAFSRTANSVKNMVENGIKVTIITSITGLNISNLEEIYHLVTSLGAWKWQLQPLFPLGRGSENEFLHLTQEQFLELGMYIYKLRPKALTSGLDVVPADSCGYFSSLDFPEFGWQGCGAGRFSCGIMSDGHVKGCLSWPDTIIEGDLRKNDLWTIWFRPEAFFKQRTFIEDDIKGSCIDCNVAMDCGGGCQAMSLAATGEWRADPFCYRRLMNR